MDFILFFLIIVLSCLIDLNAMFVYRGVDENLELLLF